MPLEVGSRLGHYNVTALIGEGGMGQVYRATDTKLNRQVALKILPEAFAQDPDRLARFQREAQVLASLNHPGIAGIYGLEESGDTHALVLELVEGPTLADRIAKGPIPLDEALPIAKQIAEALEAAHEAGVIHRDLKPANIKVRDDGTVKVLDFGLAKALEPTPEGDPSQSPTLTAAATQMGVIMGTAAYMSPEQARGKLVDKRADIWAFGCVLYEMLTGRKLFPGDDVSQTLARVIDRDPDWRQLPDGLSPVLETLLHACLHKDPRYRTRDIGDLRLALSGQFDDLVSERPVRPMSSSSLRHWSIPAFAGLVLACATTGFAVWALMRPSPPPVTQLTASLPPGLELTGSARFTPDGRSIAFVGAMGAEWQVYTRSLNGLEVTPLRGTEGANYLLDYSPDGRSLLFTDSAGSRLRRIRVSGGQPETVVTSANLSGAVWGARGAIVYGGAEGLWLVGADASEPTRLTTATEGEAFHSPSQYLPGRRAVLFTVTGGIGPGGGPQIAVYDFETSSHEILLAGARPQYVLTGHLVFWRDGGLWAVRFDRESFEAAVEEFLIVESVAFLNTRPEPSFALAANGTLAYVPGSAAASSLAWVERNGEVTSTVATGSLLLHPRISPDGTRVAFTDGGDDFDIWIRDLGGGRNTKLTEVAGPDLFPTWTPSGASVTFASGRVGGTMSLHTRPADLSGETEQLLASELNHLPGSWTPAGQSLIYAAVNSAGDRDLWTLPASGDPAPFLVTEANERAPRASPDGKWLAYVSDQPGESRVFVQAFPDGGQRFAISTGPGTEPVWSRDGSELFYRNGDQFWVVDIEVEPTLKVGIPRLLFEARYDSDPVGQGNPNYDVSLDGQRFLMARTDSGVTDELVVVQNFTEELKRVVPTK